MHQERLTSQQGVAESVGRRDKMYSGIKSALSEEAGCIEYSSTESIPLLVALNDPAIYFPSTAEMGWEATYFCMPQQHPDHYPISDGAVTIKPFHLCPRKKERVKRHLRNFSDTHRYHFLIPVLFVLDYSTCCLDS